MDKYFEFKSISKISALFLVFALTTAAFFGVAAEARAALPGPFGGQIIAARPGNNCLVIDVGPPRGGEYVFVYGLSQLFSFFSLRPGAWVLGLSGPPFVCFIGKIPIGAGPAIMIVGTSL